MKVFVVVNHMTTPDECNVNIEVARSIDEAKAFIKLFHKSFLNTYKDNELVGDDYIEGCEDYICVIEDPYTWNHCYIEEKEV